MVKSFGHTCYSRVYFQTAERRLLSATILQWHRSKKTLPSVAPRPSGHMGFLGTVWSTLVETRCRTHCFHCFV